MEDPRPQLQSALKAAMKSKDVDRRNVIRLALSAIKQVEVDTRKELSAEDVVAILQKEAKIRQESLEEMKRAERIDDAQQAQLELDILKSFLPQQLSREEITALAQDAVAQSGATSPREMGKVMGILMPKLKGQADGSLISEVVRELLSSSS